MKIRFWPAAATVALLAACGPSKEHARADSAQAAMANDQAKLATQLAAQKDSLTRIVLEADDFIMRIDSTVSQVKGLPKGKKGEQLDPLQQQIQNRKEVMARVDALVARARATAAQLAKSQKENKALNAQVESDQQMIAQLNETIQRKSAEIDTLSVRVDSLNGVTRLLGDSITTLASLHNKAFYVIGREDELLKKGVIVREGGANLLVAHPGRTLQIARKIDPSVFKQIDQRAVHEIEVPDTARRYKVVSRQSLDNAEVAQRENMTFKGNLKIAQPDRFWAPSRFLVIVEQ